MRKSITTLFLGAGLSASVAGHAADFTAKDLAAQEGRFAAASVATDMRQAFLAYFADNSAMLRPEVVDAKSWLQGRQAPAIVLDWKSQLTIMSASKDLGVSTGPSTFTSKKDPKAAPGRGYFFSIWQRQGDGDWKVLLDHGISYEGPGPADQPLEARDLPAVNHPFDPIDPEQAFVAQSAAQGAARAYGDAISARSRLLRSDIAPLDNEAAIRAYLKTLTGTWSWNTLRQGTSLAGDLTYVLGRYSQQEASGVTHHGHYIRAWVKEKAGEQSRWMLAGEVLTPLPDVPVTPPVVKP